MNTNHYWGTWPCVTLLDHFLAIVLKILLKLTHYSFSTDRVLSSTFLAIVALQLHNVTPCWDSLSSATLGILGINSRNLIHPASRKVPGKPKYSSKTLLCSVQASWRTRTFPNLDLKFRDHHVNPDCSQTPWVVGVSTWRGNSNSASSFQPMRIWILIIKQLAFVPLFYQCLLQQNIDAIPILQQIPKLISNPTSTMSIDTSQCIQAWTWAWDQVWLLFYSALKSWFQLSSLKFSVQLMFNSSPLLVMALISDFLWTLQKNLSLKLKKLC